jgi:CMP-N-acetylneuraminic acid synthetase
MTHEEQLRGLVEDPELLSKNERAACLAGAEALRREKDIAEAVHYYTGEDVDMLVQRYRDDPPAMMPAPTEAQS